MDESRIEQLADIFPIEWNQRRDNFGHLLAGKRELILLSHFLSRVSDDSASADAFNNLLRIVQKYPLLEHNYDRSDELSLLYKQVITAAEIYLLK